MVVLSSTPLRTITATAPRPVLEEGPEVLSQKPATETPSHTTSGEIRLSVPGVPNAHIVTHQPETVSLLSRPAGAETAIVPPATDSLVGTAFNLIGEKITQFSNWSIERLGLDSTAEWLNNAGSAIGEKLKIGSQLALDAKDSLFSFFKPSPENESAGSSSSVTSPSYDPYCEQVSDEEVSSVIHSAFVNECSVTDTPQSELGIENSVTLTRAELVEALEEGNAFVGIDLPPEKLAEILRGKFGEFALNDILKTSLHLSEEFQNVIRDLICLKKDNLL